ncbi:MAG: Hpt domain-containing protein [Oscillospiraceae bacterium]
MDNMLKKLNDYGADVEGAMGRFLDDVDLYKTCFKTLVEDEAFVKLGEELKAENYEQAFEYAHTLKGVIGNMGITPLYRVICSIVETLRKNELDGLQGYYADAVEQLNQLKAMQEQ